MIRLTDRQKEIYDFIKSYIQKYPQVFSPTQREIAEAIGISQGAIWGHLDLIEKKGYIRRDHNYARGITCLI